MEAIVVEVGDPNAMRTEIDRESGSLICYREFDVRRSATSSKHRVTIEIGEDGFIQNETCDCRGFQYRRQCSHIDAVIEFATFAMTLD